MFACALWARCHETLHSTLFNEGILDWTVEVLTCVALSCVEDTIAPSSFNYGDHDSSLSLYLPLRTEPEILSVTKAYKTLDQKQMHFCCYTNTWAHFNDLLSANFVSTKKSPHMNFPAQNEFMIKHDCSTCKCKQLGIWNGIYTPVILTWKWAFNIRSMCLYYVTIIILLRYVHNHFQSQFSTDHDLVLPLSNYSTLVFP